MRNGATNRVVTLWGIGLALTAVSAGQAKVNLSLEPASLSVAPGDDFAVQLWARGDSTQSFDGADVLLQWDPVVATLQGSSQEGAPYAWSVSAFLPGSPRNDTWADGDAIYTCLAPLGQPAPETDVLVTTLQFKASQNAGTTTIRIPTGGETEIAAAGVSGLGATSPATITVGSGGGGGGGDSGTNHAPTAAASASPVAGTAPLTVVFDGKGSSDSDVGDTLAYRWDFGDGESAAGATATHTYASAGTYTAVLTVTDAKGAIDTAEARIEVASGGDNLITPPSPPDDTTPDNPNPGGNTNGTDPGPSDDAAPPSGFVPLCGAGVTQGMWLSAAGLLLAGQIRFRGSARPIRRGRVRARRERRARDGSDRRL